VRRTARGRNPLRRDMGHLHHRLLALGLTPQQTVGCLLGASAAFGGVAVLLSRLPQQAALSVTGLLGLAVLIALAALTWLERRARTGRPSPGRRRRGTARPGPAPAG